MSTKRKEMTLAVAQVIRKMDALLGISDDIAMALLGHVTETEIEMKLDIQILYLRRVHHFCFYAGRWCKDCTNGCFRNRFVSDSMTCAQTCALDCEWHMIVDFKICCFHVVSLSPQQGNKVAMLSKSYSSARESRTSGACEIPVELQLCVKLQRNLPRLRDHCGPLGTRRGSKISWSFPRRSLLWLAPPCCTIKSRRSWNVSMSFLALS